MNSPYLQTNLQGGAAGQGLNDGGSGGTGTGIPPKGAYHDGTAVGPGGARGTYGFDYVSRGERPDAAQIVSWHNRLRGLYSNRNSEYYLLRRMFDAQYIGNQQRSAIQSSTEFSDRKNLIYNMLNTAVRRYMDEMSSDIQIRGIPLGLNQADLQLAEARQKLLMDLFIQEEMQLKIVMASFYQSLLDKAVFHVRPDLTKPLKLSIDLVIPEWYFPVPISGYWFSKNAVIISWIPFFVDGNMEQHDPEGRRYQNDQGLLRVIEYWDNNWYIRVENNKEAYAIEHKWGRIPFPVAHNIPIPHRERGQGDGDQSVGLNEYLNELMSDQGDTLSYLANPIVVVRGSKAGSSNLVFGPRAIWELERDGSAEILTWAGSPPSFEAQILRVMQGIEDATGLSSPAFGREIPSGVSGEAIRSILAGFNTRVGAKQTFMGLALNKVCEMAQLIWEKEFPNETFNTTGQWGLQSKARGADTADESKFGMFIKPRDFAGHYKTKIIFQPQNETVKTFAELQKMKDGVQSKLTTMRNLGIVNPDDEYKRILIERHLDMLNSAQAGVSSQQLGTSPMPVSTARRAIGAGGAQPQPGLSAPAYDINKIADDLRKSNPGTLADSLGVPQAETLQHTNESMVQVHDVLNKLRDIDLSGKVFLEGDILKEGKTDKNFNLRVENEADIPQIKQALGPMAERANFITSKEPINPSGQVRVGGPFSSQFGQ